MVMRSQAYQAGRQAYADSKLMADNPHPWDSHEHQEWYCGYRYAMNHDPDPLTKQEVDVKDLPKIGAEPGFSNENGLH